MRMFLRGLVSVFILPLLASGHLLAMELGDSFQENISGTQRSSHIPDSNVPELLPNVWYHIFDLYNALPGEVLTHHKVRQEPRLNKEVGRYFREKINLLLGQMNTFKPTLSPQKFALIFSQTVNTDLCIKDTFFKLLGEIIAKEPFFFVAVGSPLVPILQEKYLSPESPYDHLNE